VGAELALELGVGQAVADGGHGGVGMGHRLGAAEDLILIGRGVSRSAAAGAGLHDVVTGDRRRTIGGVSGSVTGRRFGAGFGAGARAGDLGVEGDALGGQLGEGRGGLRAIGGHGALLGG
jgi:hypothetical protein